MSATNLCSHRPPQHILCPRRLWTAWSFLCLHQPFLPVWAETFCILPCSRKQKNESRNDIGKLSVSVLHSSNTCRRNSWKDGCLLPVFHDIFSHLLRWYLWNSPVQFYSLSKSSSQQCADWQLSELQDEEQCPSNILHALCRCLFICACFNSCIQPEKLTLPRISQNATSRALFTYGCPWRR